MWENNSAQRIEWHNADVHFLVLFIVFGFSLEKCCYSFFNDMHANPSSEMMHISLQRPENWPVNQNAQIWFASNRYFDTCHWKKICICDITWESASRKRCQWHYLCSVPLKRMQFFYGNWIWWIHKLSNRIHKRCIAIVCCLAETESMELYNMIYRFKCHLTVRYFMSSIRP